MPRNGPLDATQVVEYINFAIICVLAALLLAGAWSLRSVFRDTLEKVDRNNRRRFFEAGCAYFLMAMIADIQMLNIGLYILWESGPAKLARVLTDNIPSKTNELVMLFCYLFFIPLTIRWLKDR